ncbi:MAG: hypothetical protein AAFP16_10600, partial [Pseudomonadota bacterium]
HRAEENTRLLDVFLKSISHLIHLEATFFSAHSTPERAVFLPQTEGDTEIHLFRNRNAVADFFTSLENTGVTWTDRSIEPYLIVQNRLSEVASIVSDLPEDQIARLRNVGLRELQDGINGLIKSDIWSDRSSDPSNPLNFLGGHP